MTYEEFAKAIRNIANNAILVESDGTFQMSALTLDSVDYEINKLWDRLA